MSFEFPVFVADRDSGHMTRFATLNDMERALERIDVENGEYSAWDANCRVIEMRVNEGTGWLVLRGGDQATDSFRDALIRHASLAKIDHRADGLDSKSANLMFEAVERQAAAVRARNGWLKRLLRRF